jgi:hypothetical protein
MKGLSFPTKRASTVPRQTASSRTLLVARGIVERTHESFRPYWKRNLETVAYWHGIENAREDIDLVVSLVIPHATRSSGHYDVSIDEITRMGHIMASNSLVCLAQIHTHPGQLLHHSGYDEAHILSSRAGFLSLIVPEYGNVSLRDFRHVSAYERYAESWVLLDEEQKAKRIRIIDDVVDLRDEARRR